MKFKVGEICEALANNKEAKSTGWVECEIVGLNPDQISDYLIHVPADPSDLPGGVWFIDEPYLRKLPPKDKAALRVTVKEILKKVTGQVDAEV